MVRIFSAILLLLTGMLSLTCHAAIKPVLTISTEHPWQRQEVIINVEIRSADKYATLNWPAQKDARYESYLHSVQTTLMTQQGQKYYKRNIRLSIFFYTTGKQTIHLPAIEYIRGGRIQEMLTLPAVNIHITPLPVYVPPDMPVGKVDLAHSNITYGSFLLRPGILNNWQLTFQGTGVAPQLLPRVLRQITGNSSLNVFKTTTSLSMVFQSNRLVSQKTYMIPFVALNNGILHMPELSWQYFDPQTGRIINRTYTPRLQFVNGWLLLVPATLLLLLMAGWLFIVCSRYIRQRWHWYRHRQQALNVLRSADKPEDLRQAMRYFAIAQEWSDNLSLFEWLEHYATIRPVTDSLIHVIQQLDSLIYARQKNHVGNISEIRSSLLKAL